MAPPAEPLPLAARFASRSSYSLHDTGSTLSTGRAHALEHSNADQRHATAETKHMLHCEAVHVAHPCDSKVIGAFWMPCKLRLHLVAPAHC
jgi:hypothetical protein